MNRRFDSISTDLSLRSGAWLFKNTSYTNWELSPCSETDLAMLVLKGKPGSGKSYLMKAAVQHAKRIANNLVLHFFLDTDEIADQNATAGSVEDLSCSLFFQLVCQAKSFPEDFLTKYDHCLKRPSGSEFDIQQAMTELLSHCHKQGVKIQIYLDEIDQSKKSDGIQNYLHAIRKSTSDGLAVDLRFCIFTRYDRSPFSTFNECPALVIENNSHEDLVRYLHEGLNRISIGPLQEKSHELMVTAMISRAGGNFRWARFVFEDFHRNPPVDDLEFCSRIAETPVGMGSFYKKILSELAGNKKDCLRLFQILLFATVPITSQWLKDALAYLKASRPSREGDGFAESCSALSRGLVHFRKRSRSCYDDLHITEYPEDIYVGFSHVAIRQYLLDGGLAEMDGLLEQDVAPKGHRLLFELCMNVIDTVLIDEEDDGPITQYAYSQWMYHARHSREHLSGAELPKCITQCGYQADKLAKRYQSHIRKNEALNSFYIQDEVNLMVLLAAEGCSEVLQNHLDHCHSCAEELDISDGPEGGPSVWERALFYATFSQHLSVVQTLIKKAGKQCNPNRKMYRSNAIYRACFTGQVEIVKLLLSVGADPTARVEECYVTPLHAATTRNKADVIKVLLRSDRHDARELLSARGRDDSTPLHLVGLYPNKEEAAKVLLEQIREENISADEIFALRDKHGKTVLDVMHERGRKKLLLRCEDRSKQQACEMAHPVKNSLVILTSVMEITGTNRIVDMITR